MCRLQVHGLPRHLAALHRASIRGERGDLRGRPRIRRQLDPRLAGDQRFRHARRARSGDCGDGSVHRGVDRLVHLQHRRSDHQGRIHARPAAHCPQGRSVSQVDRSRRRRLLRAGAGVLHPRRRAVRHQPARIVLPRRLGRRSLELGPRRRTEPGLQASLQGRLLPRSADRFTAGHPPRDGHDDGAGRHPRGEAAPRGGHRRSGRDRHAVPVAGEDGRRAAMVQAHRQERRQEARQDRHVHAEAGLPRQRLWHARPPVDLEGRETTVRR